MTAVLEEVEYLAWHLAAEPTEARMTELLQLIELKAPEIAACAGSSCHDARSPENVSEAADITGIGNLVETPADFQETSQGREDVSQSEVRLATSETQGKPCTMCGPSRGILPYSEFSVDNSRKDGLRARCRKCEAQVRRERRARA